MRRILFELGPLHINTFGFMIALGILAGIAVAVREARRQGLNEDKLYDFFLWGVLAGIVGARLGYVLAYDPGRYLQNPVEIFFFQDGGLSIHGAIIAAVLVALWWCRREKISFWRLVDTLSPSLILGQAIGRTGCDVFGKAMATPYFWGVPVGGQVLHPAQVYEFLLDYLLFFILWRRRGRQAYEGQLFVCYLVGFNLIRGTVEFFRINPYVIEPFTVGHVASLILIIAGLVVAWARRRSAGLGLQGDPVAATAAGVDTGFWRELWPVLVMAAISLALFYGLPSR